jgi:rhamnogalacturonan endolyase
MWGTDPDTIGFNLYRVAGGITNRLNGAPITNSCNFVDVTANLAVANSYFVRPVINAVEQSPGVAYNLPAGAPVQQYLSIPLTPPPGGTAPATSDGSDPGGPYSYNANDGSTGDVDGDGEYEIILKWDPTNSHDNSQSGFTGDTFLDCYKLDGTRLWRIDLGPNIRSGAHYLDFMVYDFDGDGKAEVMCRTAPGSKDGLGNYVGGAAKWQNANGPRPSFNDTDDYRNNNPNGVTNGYVLAGPEFLTVFSGQTGEELATATYYPKRDQDLDVDNIATSRMDAVWGDHYGNRLDRFLAGIAFLDGRRPSAIFCRGYYTRAFLVAWDWRNGQLTKRWVFDTNDGTPGNTAWRGQGAHSLTIGDVDGDGKDEITYGAAAIDDDGKGLYSTHLGHGDAEHLSDLDPTRPGLEVWMVHEDPGSYGPSGLECRDAKTGALIFGVDGQNADIGRGVAIDIDPRFPGCEMWGSRGGLMSATGVQISTTKPSQQNFAIWWDADLLREILDGTTITKWNYLTSSGSSIFAPGGLSSNNGTKATPCLSADLLGDWREEVIWRTSDNTELRVYTTTIVATNRFYTLMHDPQYRCAIAWQNTGYNQPPHPGFYIGPQMYPPPVSPMSDANLVWSGAASSNWDEGTTSDWFTNRVWMSDYTASVFNSGNSVLFDIGGSNSSALNLVGALAPASVTVCAPQDFIFSGAGSLTGSMSLTKAGTGKLTINNTNNFTGLTAVTEGTLLVNGSLDRSPLAAHGSVWGTTVGGNGRLGQGATMQSGSTLSPGTGSGVAGALTISNQLTETGNVLNQFDLSSDPTGASKTNDRVNIVGNLVLTGTNTIAINQPEGFLSGGVYPLFTYTGALTGGLANFVLTGSFIQPVALTNPPGAIALLAVVPAAPPTPPGGLSATAVGAFQINLNWTDNSSDENLFLIERSTGDTNNFTQIASVAANDHDYSDIGLTPLTTYFYRVRGTNLAGAGLYSNIASNTTAAPPQTLTWRGNGTNNLWDLTTTVDWFDGSGLVVYNDGVDVTFDQSGSNNTPVALVGALQPDSVTVNATKSYTFGGTGGFVGPMSLVKSGSGSLTINNTNAFSGGVTVNSGTITLGTGSSAGSGTLKFNGGNVTLGGAGQPTYPNALNIASNGTMTSSGGNNNIVSGAWSGTNRTLTISVGSGTFTISGNMTGFYGTVALGNSAGAFRFNGSSGSANTTFDLGNGSVSLINRNGVTITLGAVSGVGTGTFISGASANDAPSTYIVGGKNLNTTFNGSITDGANALRTTSISKVGSGTWTLTGANSYTGTTTISGGTLLVNGNQSAATNTVTVTLNGTLGGFGTIGGNTTVSGTLAPGNSIGTLTFNRDLTFTASGVALFELTRLPHTNDVAQVFGNLVYNGTLNVVNLSPDLLLAGDHFKLFDAAGYSGAFGALNLPALDEDLAWSTNRLTVDGSLWVVRTTPPAIGSAQLFAGNFIFSGTGGTPGWTYDVLTSTNIVLPLDQWTRSSTNVFDSSGGFAVTNAVDGGTGQRFYLISVE